MWNILVKHADYFRAVLQALKQTDFIAITSNCLLVSCINVDTFHCTKLHVRSKSLIYFAGASATYHTQQYVLLAVDQLKLPVLVTTTITNSFNAS